MRHGFLLAAWLFSLPCWGWSESATTDRDRPLFHALEALGVKYRYGGRSPETGFDCSGLIRHVFERAWGMPLPAGTEALSKVGMPIKLKELEPGDLVFYNTRNPPLFRTSASTWAAGASSTRRVRGRRRRLDPPTF